MDRRLPQQKVFDLLHHRFGTLPRGIVLLFSRRRRHTSSLCDWSSDVCSSDLADPYVLNNVGVVHVHRGEIADAEDAFRERSEERRVGKECRSRWSPDHLKKKKKKMNFESRSTTYTINETRRYADSSIT